MVTKGIVSAFRGHLARIALACIVNEPLLRAGNRTPMNAMSIGKAVLVVSFWTSFIGLVITAVGVAAEHLPTYGTGLLLIVIGVLGFLTGFLVLKRRAPPSSSYKAK